MVRFRDSSNDNTSTLQYVRIQYAGKHGNNRFGAIHLEAASPTLADSTIADSLAYAISADVASFPVVRTTTLERNGGNGLEIRSGEMASSGTWANTGIVYAVTGKLTVRDGATLTLSPGVTVKLGENCFFEVNGSFSAVGTEQARITFTSLRDDATGGDTNGDGASSVPAPGDWTMIRFQDSSNDSASAVQYAVLQYGGKYGGDRYGAVHLVAASPDISHNTFLDNHWYAISADSHSFPTATGNEMQRNAGNGLEIRGGDMGVIGSWSNTGVVYVVTRSFSVNNNATLTIDPGVIVKFVENGHINIKGSFLSLGTASQPVILTSFKDDASGGDTNGDGNSSSPAPGDWTMIRFYDESNDANCAIDHTRIQYAGRYGGDRYGAIHILSASPTITDSTIRDSYYYGIWYDANSSPVLTGNSFRGNWEGDVFQQE
jgi:parallel beta-helix repeat protein